MLKKLTFRILFFGSLCLLILCCKTKKNNLEGKEEETLIPLTKAERNFGNELAPLIQDIFDNGDTTGMLQLSDDLKIKSADYIGEIYQSNGYQPFWMADSGLNARGHELMDFFETAQRLGLNNAFYQVGKLTILTDSTLATLGDKEKHSRMANVDIAMTYAFLLAGKHLHSGILNEHYASVSYAFDSLQKIQGIDLIKSLKDKQVKDALAAIEPQIPHYQRLKEALVKFVSTTDLQPNDLKVRDNKVDSIGALKDVCKALIWHKYLPAGTTIEDSVTFYTAFKKFQRDNHLKDDGIPGENTRYALTVDNYDKFQTIILNLDRWRHMNKKTWPNEYIFVDIPKFELWYIKNDSLERKHNVVVGKTNTQTPEIESKLENIVLLPSWSVPQSIIKKEMMGRIKAGTLRGYKVTRHKNGWLSVVQPPGKGNSLGVIKFNFKNDHAVYIHDTPSKSLFSNDYRAYSHGCVRLKDPVDFGAFILTKQSNDTISGDSLRTIINKGKSKQVPITRDIPVFLKYFTAIVDYEDKLVVLKDIYKKDEKYIDALFAYYDASWVKKR
ncbi:MAG: L,D-transpeptidase family protein [Chitinophagales bacterium]|nr:L,D-transpeptidase family protein [Chitinophagales bacterium]